MIFGMGFYLFMGKYNHLKLFQVKDSWLEVHLCEGGTPGCALNETNRPGILKLPKRSSEETVLDSSTN